MVLEIDSQGAIQVKERYPDAVLILIAAPSREAQERRLRLRGDDEASIEKRLAIAADEEKLGREHRRLRSRQRRPRTGFEGARRYSGSLSRRLARKMARGMTDKTGAWLEWLNDGRR